MIEVDDTPGMNFLEVRYVGNKIITEVKHFNNGVHDLFTHIYHFYDPRNLDLDIIYDEIAKTYRHLIDNGLYGNDTLLHALNANKFKGWE